MKNWILKIVLLGAFASLSVFTHAQTGSAYGGYSPYSVYGIGDLSHEGTAFNRSMGGVGIATRNRRHINVLNPASLSSIDSSSFMADFGLKQNNKIFSQQVDGQNLISANNTFNINDFVIAFPAYKSLAFMVGITPYSDMGYNFSSYETDQTIIGNNSTIDYTHYGEGSVYQVFAGAGVEFWKRLSVGAEVKYYFGAMDKVAMSTFSDASYQDVTAGVNILVRATTAKFGLQYDQPFGKNMHLTIGGTYRMGTKMRGETIKYTFGDQSSVRDTISYVTVQNKEGLRIADELGIGVCLRKGDKWAFEVDYLRSDWTKSGLDNYEYTGVKTTGYSAAVSQSIRAGFEYVPNRNDIRYYFRRVSYRGGVYYDQSYYTYYGDAMSAKGITLGITLPVYRLYNGLNIGVDFGKRGSLNNGNVREYYATINVGFSLHDLWFHKMKYE